MRFLHGKDSTKIMIKNLCLYMNQYGSKNTKMKMPQIQVKSKIKKNSYCFWLTDCIAKGKFHMLSCGNVLFRERSAVK